MRASRSNSGLTISCSFNLWNIATVPFPMKNEYEFKNTKGLHKKYNNCRIKLGTFCFAGYLPKIARNVV